MSMSIAVQDSEPVAAGYGVADCPAGERGWIVTEGLVIHKELAQLLPHTNVTPLTSVGNVHHYQVQVRGYELAMFVRIVRLYAASDFAGAERLIAELRPSRGDELLG